jgi:hypothetical protein
VQLFECRKCRAEPRGGVVKSLAGNLP